METIQCGCGCGIERPERDLCGRKRYFINGHFHRNRTRSDEVRKNISNNLKGRIVWNKGLKTGLIPWNKGLKLEHLSKENSARYKHGKSNTQEYVNKHKRIQQAKDDPRFVFSRLKTHIKRKNATIEWEKDDFIKWYNSQEKICTYCEKKVVRHVGKTGPQHDSISIDRKNHNGPYSESNCVICCMKCNIVKSNALTFDQMKNIVGPLLKQNRESP